MLRARCLTGHLTSSRLKLRTGAAGTCCPPPKIGRPAPAAYAAKPSSALAGVAPRCQGMTAGPRVAERMKVTAWMPYHRASQPRIVATSDAWLVTMVLHSSISWWW